MATIRNHVTRDIAVLDAQVPCREAARLMGERRIGSVVVRRNGRFVGLVTERDLVTSVLATGADSSRPLEQAMGAPVPRVSMDATEIEAAGLMRTHAVRHLMVEDGGQVVGVISMRDVIQAMLDEKQFVIEQLSSYMAGR
jgi:signal-transduction protein with cAMP-binding, CBS, and nucleotidyltransferase domain